MRSKLRQKAINLRVKKEMSYSAIFKEIGVPKSTLSYWLKDYPLSEKRILDLRRKGWEKGEAGRERFRITMRKKREENENNILNLYRDKFKNLSEESHFVAGLLLYLGEGDKQRKDRISISNTNPALIKFFIKWLGLFIGIKKKDLKMQLHLYDNMIIPKEEKFWLSLTGLKKNQLYKTQVRKLRKGSFTYSHSFNHGTCQIVYCNVRKKTEISMAIQAFLDMYNN